jgi:hypothetical protein
MPAGKQIYKTLHTVYQRNRLHEIGRLKPGQTSAFDLIKLRGQIIVQLIT